MTVFDQLFFGVLSHYKSKKNKHAKTIALWYITLVHIALMFVLGVFLSEFFKQMNIVTFSRDNAKMLFSVIAIGLLFKNWIQYSGRKLTIRNAKKSSSKPVERSIYVLWFVPIGLIGLSVILLNIL